MYSRDDEYRPRDLPLLRGMYDSEDIPVNDHEARLQCIQKHLQLPDAEVLAVRDEAGNVAKALHALEDRAAEQFRVANLNAAARDER